MTSRGGNSYAYDTGNSMVKQNGRWYFLYTFSGERIASIDWQGSIATRGVDWTIRGPGNQVLSTFKLVGEDQAGNWSREIDYIWMGRRLLGTEDGSGVKKHYHTDHLGSIRLVTNAAGNKVSEHEYLPYGQELTAAGNGVMKFTGHERDSDTGMDYMHARFYSSFLGRFNSVDPILGGGGVLNRYSYVGGRPMNFVDPTGRRASGKYNKTIYVTACRTDDCITVTATPDRLSYEPISYLVGGLTGHRPRPPYGVDPLANIAPRFWFCDENPSAPFCGGAGATGDDDGTNDDGPFPEPFPELDLPTLDELKEAVEDLASELKDLYCSVGVGVYWGATVGEFSLFGRTVPGFSSGHSVTTNGWESYETTQTTGNALDVTLAFGVDWGSVPEGTSSQGHHVGVGPVTYSSQETRSSSNTMVGVDLGLGFSNLKGTTTTQYRAGPCD